MSKSKKPWELKIVNFFLYIIVAIFTVIFVAKFAYKVDDVSEIDEVYDDQTFVQINVYPFWGDYSPNFRGYENEFCDNSKVHIVKPKVIETAKDNYQSNINYCLFVVGFFMVALCVLSYLIRRSYIKESLNAQKK